MKLEVIEVTGGPVSQKLLKKAKDCVPETKGEWIFLVGTTALGGGLGMSVAKGILARAAAAAVGTVAGGAILGVNNEIKYQINPISWDEVNSNYVNAHNDNWHIQYYIQHPKYKKATFLIDPGQFAKYIEKERLSEIINYLMKIGRFNDIVLETSNKNGFKGEVKLNELCDFKGTVKNLNKNKIEIAVDHLEPSAENEKFDYVWMEDEFKALKTAIDNSVASESATLTYNQEFENKFQVNGEMIAKVGLDLDLTADTSYFLKIEASRT